MSSEGCFGGFGVATSTGGNGEGFRMSASCGRGARHGEAGVRKPPKEETAFQERALAPFAFQERALAPFARSMGI
jgi:hypothetical protein